MRSRILLSLIAICFLSMTAAIGEPNTAPITTARGEVGDLLRKWYAEGTAAGNIGDWYDNRDRGHSNLDLTPYPQIQKVTYTEEDRAAHRDWAAQVKLVPNVVFGNSSTSAPVNGGGSNVRTYYVYPQGIRFLYAEYARNNIYMYPEHCDHRPGHNGTPNHGDLYPTNTPFLITSQGSSGSDQPFMHAVPYTLAAFRPDVKKKLVETGMLMPTLQMILRSSNKNIKDPQEYFTGKAHPSVFDGSQVDPLKMVNMAHAITMETIPPVVQLKILEEDSARLGIDYFEQGGDEKHGDTPIVISRIFRSATQSRRMVVSAEGSIDVNKHPLKITWSLLQGDPTKIKITPKNASGSTVEIVVQYQDRRPIQPGSPLESNRVEVGVFVDNGSYVSAPGFITWFTLDNEARTYDDAGRLLEIGYAMGDPTLSVSSWPGFFELLKSDATPSAGAKLLLSRLTEAELIGLRKAAEEYAPANAAVAVADQKRKEADAAAKAANKDTKPAADAALKTATTAHQAAMKVADEVLTKSREAIKLGVKVRVESALNEMAADPMFSVVHSADLLSGPDAGKKSVITNAAKRLIGLGIANEKNEWTPIRAGSSPVAERLTRYEKAQIQRFNNELIASLALRGIVNAVWRENFVDPRLTAPKSWRDVYHYDEKGNRTGWTRYDGQKPTEFNADGMIILETDPENHPTRLAAVKYERQQGPNFPLKQILVDDPKGKP